MSGGLRNKFARGTWLFLGTRFESLCTVKLLAPSLFGVSSEVIGSYLQ